MQSESRQVTGERKSGIQLHIGFLFCFVIVFAFVVLFVRGFPGPSKACIARISSELLTDCLKFLPQGSSSYVFGLRIT